MSSLAETRRLTGWSRQPEPDALEDEGLWSEPISSTGCEVMRPSRLHAKDGLTLRIPNAKGDAQCQNERARQRPQRRAGARSLVTVCPAAGASRSLRSLPPSASPRF